MVPVAASTSRTSTLPVESWSSTTPASRSKPSGSRSRQHGQRHLGRPIGRRAAGRARLAGQQHRGPDRPPASAAARQRGPGCREAAADRQLPRERERRHDQHRDQVRPPVSPASSPTTTVATAPQVPGRNRVWRTEWARSVHPMPTSSSANQLSGSLPGVVRSRPARRGRHGGPVARRPRRTRPASPRSRAGSSRTADHAAPPGPLGQAAEHLVAQHQGGVHGRRVRARAALDAHVRRPPPAVPGAQRRPPPRDSTASRAAHQPGPSSTRARPRAPARPPADAVPDVDVGEQREPQPSGRAQRAAERGEDALVLVAHGDPERRHDQRLPAGAFLGPRAARSARPADPTSRTWRSGRSA